MIKIKGSSSNRKLDFRGDNNENFKKYIRFLNKKKIDINRYKRVIIPILIKNKSNFSNFMNQRLKMAESSENSEKFHWALVSVNLKKMTMILYDSKFSFSEEGKSAMQTLAMFFDYQKHKSVETKNSFSTMNFSEKDFPSVDEICENRFDSEESSEDEDSSDKSSTITQNKSFINEEDVYFNCKRILNFDENESVERETAKSESNSKWIFKFAKNPRQSTSNSIDSGIFVMKFMEYLTRQEPIIFTKEDIEYFRILTSIELIESKLMTG